jgi:hypothetical protein
MAAGDRSPRAAVNVLGARPFGRFSGVHQWPLLAVHRGSWSERIDSDFVAEPGELPMRDRSRPEELRLAVVR